MANDWVTYRWVTNDKVVRIRWGSVERPKPQHYQSVNTYVNENQKATGDVIPWSPSTLFFPADDPTWVGRMVDPEVASWRRVASRKFRRKCRGDTAGIGITVVQWKQSLDMMSKRLRMIGSFARLIPVAAPILFYRNLLARKRALRALSRSLNYPVNSAAIRRLERRSNREWRSKIRTPGDLFLEFWFGWSPLVNDIYEASKILSDPHTPDRAVRVQHKGQLKEVYTDFAGQYRRIVQLRGHGNLGIFARVSVTNPNAYLAEKLGLANPATIVLDAIPFSWMLNWFVNVQEYVDALNWDAGLDIKSGGYGYAWQGTIEHYQHWSADAFRGTVVYNNKYRFDRLPTDVANVSLKLQAPVGSAARAAVALSVLLQKLAKFSTPFHLR